MGGSPQKACAAPLEGRAGTHKYPSGQCQSVGPGALVYRSSPSEVRRWRAAHVGIGIPLALVGLLSVWAGLAGGLSGDGSGGGGEAGTSMVLLLYVAVGAVLIAFGLRYALLGVRGRGVVLYERAVEADFPGRWFVMPERRLEGLVRVRVEGTPKATSAYAIAASGHAVALPSSFVARSDLWRLGALGNRPVAPGGKAAAMRAKGARAAATEADVLVDLEARPAGAPTSPSTGGAPTRWRSGRPEPPAPLRPSPSQPKAAPRAVPPPPHTIGSSPPPPPSTPSPPTPSPPPSAAPDEGLLLELEPIEAPPPRPSPPPPPTMPDADMGFELEPIEAPPAPLPSSSPVSPPAAAPPAPKASAYDWEEVEVPRG